MSDFERDFTAPVTFADFDPKFDAVYNIGGDVIPQMAEVFGHNLTDGPDVDNLGELIGAIGPAKTLQDNINQVERRIGSNDDAADLARDWVEKSGLLVPVERSLLNPNIDLPYGPITGIITGGVRNWIQRRADMAIKLSEKGKIFEKIILASGNRVMSPNEGEDVSEGMTETQYMNLVVAHKLHKNVPTEIELAPVESKNGEDVAKRAVIDIEDNKGIMVISNAGAWVQNAGQISRAFRDEYMAPVVRDVYVVSDEFPLGTGKEPTSTHQNPFSALGQIARNAQELARHQS